MAVKTITIDGDKKDVPASKTARTLLENLDTILLSDETLDAVDKLVKERGELPSPLWIYSSGSQRKQQECRFLIPAPKLHFKWYSSDFIS